MNKKLLNRYFYTVSGFCFFSGFSFLFWIINFLITYTVSTKSMLPVFLGAGLFLITFIIVLLGWRNTKFRKELVNTTFNKNRLMVIVSILVIVVFTLLQFYYIEGVVMNAIMAFFIISSYSLFRLALIKSKKYIVLVLESFHYSFKAILQYILILMGLYISHNFLSTKSLSNVLSSILGEIPHFFAPSIFVVPILIGFIYLIALLFFLVNKSK